MNLLGTALLACAVALAVVPIAARRARRLGRLDVPSERSSHARPVPRTGGVGLLAALFVATAGAAFAGILGWDAAWRFLLPAAAWFAIGWADDVRGLRPRTKFVLQALAALLSVAVGFRWEGRGVGPFPDLGFGAATPAMTWLWFVAVGIVVNFVDGIDLITCATCAVVTAAAAGSGAGPGDGAVYAAAAGGVVGLAFWNATPAHVFAGDAGTHLLGFLVASVACALPGLEPPSGALPWALASAPLLPGVIDVGWGILSKARRGVPLVLPHNDHLYQRLTKAGWSHAAVAIRYGALSLLAVLLVGRVAPALGWAATVAGAALVLGLHLAHGVAVSRRLPDPGSRTIPRP